MCIRDRGQTGREAFVVLDGTVVAKRNGKKIANLGRGAVVGELSLLDHGPRTATAVSYTHLRAHETVLDLVCRLLLEKKKLTMIHMPRPRSQPRIQTN